MNRRELRLFVTAFSQAEGTPDETIDLFLRQAAVAFARDVGGLRGEVTLTGEAGDGRSYNLPDVNQIVAGYYVDSQPERLIEGDSTNGLGLDVLRDPDFDYGSGYPEFYALEQAQPPRVWFDVAIPVGKQVQLTVTLNAVTFGTGDTDVPGLPEPYHEALGYYAAAYAARSQRDEVAARERQREYDELVEQYRYERANREPAGMALRDPPDFVDGGEGWDGFTNLRITSTAGGRSSTGAGVVSKEAVYGFLKQIARDSDSIDITVDDAAQTLTFTVAMGAALSQAQRDTLEGAVQLDSIQTSDRDLVFATDSGQSRSVTTPAITVADEGSDLGSPDTVDKLNITGSGATATRAANEVTINIPGASSGGGGLTGAQVDTRIANNPAVQSAGRFEDALRVNAPLMTRQAFTVTANNRAAAAGTVAVPANEADRELLISLPGVSAQAFQLSAFRGKTAAGLAVILDNGNSVALTGGGITYRIGRDASGNFVASASATGTYSLTIVDSRIDVEDFSRRSSPAQVPASKLPSNLGLTVAQVEALIKADVNLQELEEFEQAMRRRVRLVGSASIQQAASRAALRVPGLPKVPAALYDNELIVKVGTNLEYTFDVSALLAKPSASQGDQLSQANSITWTQGDDSFHIAHEGGAGSNFLFASDDVGTHIVTITEDGIDLEAWARPSTTATIPATRLPQNQRLPAPSADQWMKWNAAGDALENTAPPQAGGLDQAAVDARVVAGTEPYARPGTARIPEGRLPQDVDDLMDAIDEAGWDAAPAGEGRIATTFPQALPATLAAAQALVYTSPTVADISPRLTNDYAVIRFTTDAAAASERSKFTLTVQSASGHVENRLDLGSMVSLGSGGGFSYFALQIDDIPVGATVELQKYEQFHIDRAKLDTGVPLGTDADDGKVLTRRVDGPAWEALRRLHGLKVLHDGSITGVTLTALNAARAYGALTQFSPVFDLDTAGNGSGEFHVELVLTVVTRSANDIGFGAAGTDLRKQVSGLLFASTLEAASDFVVAGLVGAQEVASIDLNKGAAKQGTFRLYFAHDANNQVGYFFNYTPESGADSTANASISARLEASFLPADTGGGRSSPSSPTASTSGKGDKVARFYFPISTRLGNAGTQITVVPISGGLTGYSVGAGLVNLPRPLPDGVVGYVFELLTVNVSPATLTNAQHVLRRVFVPFTPEIRDSGQNVGLGDNELSLYKFSFPASTTSGQWGVDLRLFVPGLPANRDRMVFYSGFSGTLTSPLGIDIFEWKA